MARRPRRTDRAARLLEAKIRRSKWALFFERLWPRAWLPIGTALLFLLVSFAGLWLDLGATWHMSFLVAFSLAGLGSLLPLFWVRWPSREAAILRLERGSGIPHRPASAYDDVLSPATKGGPVQPPLGCPSPANGPGD